VAHPQNKGTPLGLLSSSPPLCSFSTGSISGAPSQLSVCSCSVGAAIHGCHSSLLVHCVLGLLNAALPATPWMFPLSMRATHRVSASCCRLRIQSNQGNISIIFRTTWFMRRWTTLPLFEIGVHEPPVGDALTRETSRSAFAFHSIRCSCFSEYILGMCHESQWMLDCKTMWLSRNSIMRQWSIGLSIILCAFLSPS